MDINQKLFRRLKLSRAVELSPDQAEEISEAEAAALILGAVRVSKNGYPGSIFCYVENGFIGMLAERLKAIDSSR